MEKIKPNLRKKKLRKTFLELRNNLASSSRIEANIKISNTLNTLLKDCEGPIAFYWPMKNEYDPVEVISKWLMKSKSQAALPVIIEKNAPMKFLSWDTNTILEKGILNLLVPSSSAQEIRPKTIIIPCVGFDSNNYRLGYGGGYYDRTLTNFSDSKKIGICYGSCKVSSLEPNEYDIPMDLIICS